MTFPLWCMLDLGHTSLIISPETAWALQIPVVKRLWPGNAADIGGRRIHTEGFLTLPVCISIEIHRTLDEYDHVFEVMKSSSSYDGSIPAWYLDEHKDQWITRGHLHFPYYFEQRFSGRMIHPEYDVTYDEWMPWRPDAIYIGGVIFSIPSILPQLAEHEHKWLLLYNPKESEMLPDLRASDHHTELKTVEENLTMGHVHLWTKKEEKSQREYLVIMSREWKIRPSYRTGGSPTPFVSTTQEQG